MHPNAQTNVTLRPTLLFYCQHSLGIGHLTRSFALTAALLKHFHVVFLNGGRLPPGLQAPAGVEMIDLPALGMDDGHTVVSRDASYNVAQAQTQRCAMILAAVHQHRPAVVLVELFPFGRKKFAGEILPMLRAAKRQGGPAPLVACSLRDILVDSRPDQQQHDDRARWLADRYFNAVLVHADPSFTRLEDSFHPRKRLQTPVHYTGYVVPQRESLTPTKRGDHLLVSAGGGIVGDALFHNALQAQALLHQTLTQPLPMRIIAGPFLPEAQWVALQHAVRDRPHVTLLRHVPDMVAEMRAARASLSQCGYNTALDIVVAGVPALVVPYAAPAENEQTDRATRMAALGAMHCLAAQDMTPQSLAAKLHALLSFEPRRAALQLDGATRSAQVLQCMHAARLPITQDRRAA